MRRYLKTFQRHLVQKRDILVVALTKLFQKLLPLDGNILVDHRSYMYF